MIFLSLFVPNSITIELGPVRPSKKNEQNGEKKTARNTFD